MPPRFFYFDLGNVLLFFDHQQGCRQMAEAAGIDDPARVWQAVFESGLELDYEAGKLSSREFHEIFCQRLGVQAAYEPLVLAAGAIFEVNMGIKPILAHLAEAGHRLGLLSNTNEIHWNYFSDGRYSLIPDAFETLVLSYEVGCVKPEPRIYEIAAERAGVDPSEIFYIDDIPGHIAAALAQGWDAVQYTTAPALASALRARGVEFNY